MKRKATDFQGEVQNFRERTERKGSNNPSASSNDTIIWTFNLVRFNEGEQLPSIPVEMRGQTFSGFINDGDTVALLDKWTGKGLHRTKRVLNQTTGVEVRAKKRANLSIAAIGASIGTVISFIILMAFCVIILAALTQG